jgi:transposase
VRVRDLPIAGRVTHLVRRKRRYRCQGCGRTFTESHPDLPPRQRMTRRFRLRLFERCPGGAAHAEVARCERTTRYQVARAFQAGAGDEVAARGEARPARRLSLDEAHHRRGSELAIVVSDLDRKRVVEVLDGRTRSRWSASALAARRPQAGDRGRLDRPLRGLPPSDPKRAAGGADRDRRLPPRARRQHRARLGPARAPARGRAGASRR